MVVAVVVVVDGSKSSSGRIICLVRVVVIYGCIKSLRIPTGTDALLQTSCTMKAFKVAMIKQRLAVYAAPSGYF